MSEELKVGDSVDVVAGTYAGGKSIIMKLNDKGDHAILQASNLWIPVAHLKPRAKIEQNEPLPSLGITEDNWWR